jgi:hypothetical protein
MARIPPKNLPPHGKTFKTANELYDHLEDNHGISPTTAGDRLHRIKQQEGYGAADHLIFDHTGNLYDPDTREWVGSLTEGGGG